MPNDLLKKTPKLSDNKMLFGVVAGLAEYFGIDVTVARLIYAALTIITGVFPGVVLYVVAYVIMKGNEPTVTNPAADQQ